MAADSTTSPRPDLRFLFAHPAHLVALGFGAGLVPRAPGTFGTLVGLALYWLLAQLLPPLVVAFCAIPLFFVGVWVCGITGRDLGVDDHGAIVWDEVVAFLPLAAISSAAWWLQAIAFVLFRIFDIWKPYPIRDLERQVKGGWGVMIDDIVAGFYAYVVFALFIVIVYKGFGYAG
jgi:phosphatidylglycerophosphatase A